MRALTSACAFAAATSCARPRARRHRSLNILTTREQMGLSSCRRLILLASHSTRERKNSSRIAREIEIPTLVPKNNLRFRVFRHTICWSWLRKSLSSILGFRTPNFAQRNTLVCWNRIKRHSGFGRRNIRKWKFDHWRRPVENESSPFCRTKWFHIHVKMAIFHLSVWLIGRGGSKLCSRPGFYSWQCAAQAGKWCWAENCKFCNFFLLQKLEILIQGLIEPT